MYIGHKEEMQVRINKIDLSLENEPRHILDNIAFFCEEYKHKMQKKYILLAELVF